jgi:pimeloyl-ACP methyl ester carboxylesterase
VSVLDIEMEVAEHGAGALVFLLLHGLGGSRRTWDSLAPLLAAHGRVLVPDLRGCGDTTRGTAAYTLAQVADDIAALAKTVSLPPFVAIGHSLGGVIAQELALRHSALLRGLVLVSTSSRLSETATKNWLRLAELVELKGVSPSPESQARGYSEEYAAAHPDVVARHAQLAAATDRTVYAKQARAASRYDYTHALASLTIPTLVVQGLADRLTPPGGSVILQRAIPRSRLAMVEGAGHNLPIEQPEQFAKLIIEFARERVPA